MSQEKNLVEISDSLKKHIGSALKVILASESKSKSRLANLLKKKFGWRATRGFISKIESGKFQISFGQLRKICTVLECSIEKFLKCATFLRDQEGRPEAEINQEIIDETEYQIWRHRQEK